MSSRQHAGGDSPTSDRLVVLHVTDRYGGGVASAVNAYVRNTSSVATSHLLASVPEDVAISGGDDATFSSIRDLPRGPRKRIMALRRAVADIKPDVIHAHSSFAGVLVRSSYWGAGRIVYSPHCFAFERTDISRFLRQAFRSAEWALGLKTDVLAACSDREAAIGKRVSRRSAIRVVVPNVPSQGAQLVGRLERSRPALGGEDNELRVVGIGRLGAQKDPHWFRDVVRDLAATSPVPVRAFWLGSGRDEEVRKMTEGSVGVSGWLRQDQLLHRLLEHDLYVHSAAWEGFPLALVDAIEVGVPTLVRQIPAFAGIAPHLTVEGGREGLARSLSSPSNFEAWSVANVRDWRSAISRNTDTHQRLALQLAYGIRVSQ